jgi:hypothetical protein
VNGHLFITFTREEPQGTRGPWGVMGMPDRAAYYDRTS